MKNTAVYGGAFNPPTLGHEKVVSGIITQTKIDKIILTPDGYRLDKNYGVDQAERKRIIDIFYNTLRESGFDVEIDTHFLEGKNGSNTNTVDVDQYFTQALGFTPYHIFGSDVIESMPDWSGNYDRYIEQRLKKVFVSRPGYTLDTSSVENFILADIDDLIEISSTTVKQMLATRMNVEQVLHPDISRYIKQNNLIYG